MHPGEILNDEEEVNYELLTVAELKEVAKEKGIEITSTMKKDDILKAIIESEG